MKILVTGAAGFIGFHLCQKFIALNHEVIGLDNLNDYYDPNLKLARLNELGIVEKNLSYNKLYESALGNKFKFTKINIEDRENLPTLFEKENFDIVINLAAQAGVRYSIENPFVYAESNVMGFLNILECCRKLKIEKLLFASSSSVYGLNEKIPFSTEDNVDHPISLYAATKKSNELMAHTYSYLYNIKTIGLRFFTVYGPWGRPDMAMFLFTDAILNNRPIKVFNNGNLSRDFTYIDDIINGITAIVDQFDTINLSDKKYKIYNIGNNEPVKLIDFISEIEKNTGITAEKEMLPMQPGDVEKTWANIDELITDTGYTPKTSIKEGVANFINWYKNYYKV